MDMPYLLEDLIIDRVDLVDEGANSASFIQLFKRKEMSKRMEFNEIISKLMPEELEIVNAELAKQADEKAALAAERDTLAGELNVAKEDITAATTSLEDLQKELEALKEEKLLADEEAKKATMVFDEEQMLKSMPEELKEAFIKMRDQKIAAEEEVRKAREAAEEAEAIAKAASLKSLPVEQSKLVSIVKKCDAEMLDVLTTINTAIDSVVLGEVGKKSSTSTTNADAWEKIDAKATEIVGRDNVTKQKAIATALKENPELYKEYLEGGKN